MSAIQRAELDRLHFVWDRDGVVAARAFAQQTFTQYRKARGTGYGKEFRRQLVESCVVLRRFMRVNRNPV